MSNFERPPEPIKQARKRPYLWWAFALHLAACYFIPVLFLTNEFLFRSLERKGWDVYVPILAVIGGIIFACAGKSWILRILLFVVGIIVTVPIVVTSIFVNACVFRQECL